MENPQNNKRKRITHLKRKGQKSEKPRNSKEKVKNVPLANK